MSGSELYHYGVIGMKWGVRRKKVRSEKEKRALINDAKSIMSKEKVKAKPGTHLMVVGNYTQKRGSYSYLARHIVDEFGKVKLSYINGRDGELCIASGKKYVEDNINLKAHFKNIKDIDIEYDVYD